MKFKSKSSEISISDILKETACISEIKGNGVKINNQLINDEKLKITKDLFSDNFIKLSLGKKRHIKVSLS